MSAVDVAYNVTDASGSASVRPVVCSVSCCLDVCYIHGTVCLITSVVTVNVGSASVVRGVSVRESTGCSTEFYVMLLGSRATVAVVAVSSANAALVVTPRCGSCIDSNECGVPTYSVGDVVALSGAAPVGSGSRSIGRVRSDFVVGSVTVSAAVRSGH